MPNASVLMPTRGASGPEIARRPCDDSLSLSGEYATIEDTMLDVRCRSSGRSDDDLSLAEENLAINNHDSYGTEV